MFGFVVWSTSITSSSMQKRCDGETFVPAVWEEQAHAFSCPAGSIGRLPGRRDRIPSVEGRTRVVAPPVDPSCQGFESEGEKMCRKIFEELYDRPFPRVRPDFLRNPKTGYNLELDGYCDELKLAFEYNGKQHYCRVEYFHPSEEDFTEQVARDKYKIRRCAELGIALVIVPYSVPVAKIKEYILTNLPGSLRDPKDVLEELPSSKSEDVEVPGMDLLLRISPEDYKQLLAVVDKYYKSLEAQRARMAAYNGSSGGKGRGRKAQKRPEIECMGYLVRGQPAQSYIPVERRDKNV